MFAPEQVYRKCPWWHRLFRCWRCKPIKFKGVTLPSLPELPELDSVLEEIAKIQPLDDSVATVFYLDK